MKKVLKILSHIVLTGAFIAYIAYQFRTDPDGEMLDQAVPAGEVVDQID